MRKESDSLAMNEGRSEKRERHPPESGSETGRHRHGSVVLLKSDRLNNRTMPPEVKGSIRHTGCY